MDELRLARRLRWAMFIRFAFTLLAITAILLLESGFKRSLAATHLPTYYTLIFACGINAVYLIATRAGASPRRMAILQLSVDVLIVSALVYLTGVDRAFAYLYFAPVIAAALLIRPRAGYLFASVATILLAAVTVAYFVSVHAGVRLPLTDVQLWHEYGPRRSFLIAYLLLFAVSLHLVAFLSSLLADEVSRVRILNDEILLNMAGGVLAVDRYGGIAFLNPPAARLMGVAAPEKARGRPYAEVLPGPIATTIEHALRGGTRIEREIRLDRTPVHVVVSYLTEEPGRLRGVVAILNDLSLQRERDAMAEREGRVRALVEMSAGMAHEVRNPLASIRGAAQELESSPAASDDDRKLLKVIMRESDRLDKIIAGFLEYASDRPMDLALCNVADALEDIYVLLAARAEARLVRVSKDWPRELTCRADADRLKQVFLNLGINALEACSEHGGGNLRLRAAAAAAGARPGIAVEFQDDGPGIPSDVGTKIFTPFFSTKPRGTGMGLAIARKIILRHGGDITVDSKSGRGTTVRVWLPA